MDFPISIYRVSNVHVGDNELTSLPLWPHGFRGIWSLSENKGPPAGRGQRTRQLNGLASIGTPSLVTRCVVQTI